MKEASEMLYTVTI